MMLVPQILEALNNLIASKLRSALAVLGILIGTASVVAMVSCGEMATAKALEQFKLLGTNLMAVSFYSESDNQGNSAQLTLTAEQAAKMHYYVPAVTEVAPYISLYLPIIAKGQTLQGSIIGVNQSLGQILKIQLLKGRFISSLDNYSHYCVIGNGIYQALQTAGMFNPLGKQIRLGTHFFTIVGIAKHWPDNSFFNQTIDSSVLIPIKTSYLLDKSARINNIILYLTNGADINIAEKKIQAFILSYEPSAHLFFHSAKQIIKSMQKQSQIYTVLLGLIGSIALVVGGIGVMNIMLVSVTERRREIGIRKAVGARRLDIRLLFLIEAVFLSLFGGVFGILLGILASAIIAYLAQWNFSIFIIPVLTGFGVSVAIGIFFGYYPAHQASKLDPIETLRSD